jgi:hypothetical protein
MRRKKDDPKDKRSNDISPIARSELFEKINRLASKMMKRTEFVIMIAIFVP